MTNPTPLVEKVARASIPQIWVRGRWTMDDILAITRKMDAKFSPIINTFINEYGNQITLWVEGGRFSSIGIGYGVVVHANGPVEKIDHAWTLAEAQYLYEGLQAILEPKAADEIERLQALLGEAVEIVAGLASAADDVPEGFGDEKQVVFCAPCGLIRAAQSLLAKLEQTGERVG